MTPGLRLETLPGIYAVCRLAPDAPLPAWTTTGWVSITRTAEELSIVCDEAALPADASALRVERGWAGVRVAGTLDFGLTGILAGLTAPLARDGVSVFAISTFDTDYLLVRATDLERARRVWREAGYDL